MRRWKEERIGIADLSQGDGDECLSGSDGDAAGPRRFTLLDMARSHSMHGSPFERAKFLSTDIEDVRRALANTKANFVVPERGPLGSR